jgi:hypothetical protein
MSSLFDEREGVEALKAAAGPVTRDERVEVVRPRV